MKIIFERGADGEILSLETITEKEGVLSDGERSQLQTYLMQKDISEDQKEIIIYIFWRIKIPRICLISRRFKQ